MGKESRDTMLPAPEGAAATPWPWPAWGLTGFAGGVALQLQQAALWHAGAYLGALLSGGALLVLLARRAQHRRWRPSAPAVALLAGLLIGGASAGWRATAIAADALDPALEGVDLVVTGLVDRMPQHVDGGVRLRLAVEAAWRADDPAAEPVTLPPALSIGWYARRAGRGGDPPAALPALQAGDRWRMTVRLKAPHGNLNPHGFDYELWAWEQGFGATGYVRDGSRSVAPRRLASTWQRPVERLRQGTREAILARVADASSAGVVAALVTGDQAVIARDDWRVFRVTGVAHLMSISGLHVTMFAWLAAGLGGALWRRSAGLMLAWPAPKAALVIGVLLAALYALFSGWGVPSQRTVCMLAVVGLLRIAGLQWPWPYVWLLACAVVVAIDPWALLQAGFWLSFVAVGVLFAAAGRSPHGRPGGVLAALWRMCREQWVVTLALAPLTVLLFNQLSLVGLLANLLAIPWVTLVVTPLAMAGAVLAPLWDVAGWAVQALMVVLRWLAALPGASPPFAAPPLAVAVGGVLGGVLLVMRLPWSLRLGGLPLLLAVLLRQPARPATGQFDLLAVDIGQGNAVLVRTAGHSLLYDAGPAYGSGSDAGDRVLVPLLRALGERLDLLVLSHRDRDHTGGAAAVLAAQPGAQLLASLEPDHPLQAVRDVVRCRAGQRWTWDGVQFEVLHPPPGEVPSARRANAASCVLRVGNGSVAALLAGDIERRQEAALLDSASDRLRADLLLVPHHGSKTSSSAPFLDAVRPRIALVQAGYRNRFGHPAAEVAARYATRGVRLVGNVRCGAARWASSAPAEVGCQRQQDARYWRHRPP